MEEKNTLLKWVNCCVEGGKIDSLNQLIDGSFFLQVLAHKTAPRSTAIFGWLLKQCTKVVFFFCLNLRLKKTPYLTKPKQFSSFSDVNSTEEIINFPSVALGKN